MHNLLPFEKELLDDHLVFYNYSGIMLKNYPVSCCKAKMLLSVMFELNIKVR